MLRGGTEETPTMRVVSGPIQTLQDCRNPNKDQGFAREMSIALEFQEPYFHFFFPRSVLNNRSFFYINIDRFIIKCIRKVYSQRFTFFLITFCYVTALFQIGFNSLFLQNFTHIPYLDFFFFNKINKKLDVHNNPKLCSEVQHWVQVHPACVHWSFLRRFCILTGVHLWKT